MHIESYSFGVMKIDGIEYSSDLMILGDKVVENWWRNDGHSLAVEDLQEVFEFKPDVLVVGQGASGLMKVPESTKKAIEQEGVKLIAGDTRRMCDVFNEEIARTSKAAGAFHLTC